MASLSIQKRFKIIELLFFDSNAPVSKNFYRNLLDICASFASLQGCVNVKEEEISISRILQRVRFNETSTWYIL